MRLEGCLRALDRLGTEPEEQAVVNRLLKLLVETPARPGWTDRGFVLSLAEGSDSRRAFHDLHASGDGWPPAEFAGAARARLAQFEGACRSLNDEFGFELPAGRFAALGSRLLLERRPPWPFFGFKSSRGKLALTLYLSDLAPSPEDPLLPSDGILQACGCRTEDVRESGLDGALDCLGVTGGSDGGWEVKLYARTAPPAGDPRFDWWRRLAREHRVRSWTKACRMAPGARPTVKSEIHFEEPIAVGELRRAPDPWLASAADRIEPLGARVSSLAVEDGRGFIYFR
jgi:hypothetical protein